MSAQKHLLSKSTFMYGCQCPLRLYYHKFRDDLRNQETEEQQAIFTSGTNVGLLAQGFFPGGIDVSPPDAFSYHISVARTQELIKAGQKIIYEAAFNYDGILCAVDILISRNGKWYAYEVKGTLKPKEPHKMDASLQYYVLTNAGIALEDFFILNLNKAYTRRGELDIQKLFKPTSVLKEVLLKQKFIKNKAAELKELLRVKIEPVIEPGDHCFDPYDCDFTDHCRKDIPEEVDNTDYGKEEKNKKAIDAFVNALEYPLYFFDFETVMPAIPLFDESHPFQQLPFQFSLHIQKTPGAEPEHVEYLGDGLNDPRENLIKELLKHSGNKGSILVWYQTFEIQRLEELARDFPKYAAEINKFINRIVDLIVPFRKKFYKHPGFKGSASLKDVMPVIVPELSYSGLNIQEGTAASMAYATLRDQPNEIQKQLREGLLAYCKLDTLAMVEILKKLQNL